MIEAKSMYFGGEIIAASECDYQSSRELGLICPFCNSAVFIRSESVRQVRGKLQLVKPYFAHYPSGNADNWDCEKRSHTKQGREEIEKLKIQAKNQRLKLYNAHLWSMIATDRNISYQKLNQVRSLFGERWCEQTSILVRHEWSRSQDLVCSFVDASAEDIRHQAENGHYLLNCDLRLHKAIACEVADFLSTDTGGYAFVKVFKASLWFQMNAATGWGASQIKQLQPISHISSIAILLAAVRWIELTYSRH